MLVIYAQVNGNNMKEQPMKATGYCRVSSQEQVDGTSLQSQENQIRTYSAMKGIDLVAVLVDAGVSGGKPLAERPEGSKLTSMVESGEVQGVVITKLDRGFRSASDCLNNVEAWERRTVSLHILNLGGQQIDTSTPMGKFFITVMAGAAELERNMIRERCSEGRKIRKAQGCRVGEIPYGFDLESDTNRLVENPQVQDAINLMVQRAGQGHSYRRIAKELNRGSIRTKKGANWTHRQVAAILRRAA